MPSPSGSSIASTRCSVIPRAIRTATRSRVRTVRAPRSPGAPLDTLPVGNGGEVERLPDRDPQALRAWEEVGLVPGAYVVVLASEAGGIVVSLEDGQMVHIEDTQASGIIVRG